MWPVVVVGCQRCIFSETLSRCVRLPNQRSGLAVQLTLRSRSSGNMSRSPREDVAIGKWPPPPRPRPGEGGGRDED